MLQQIQYILYGIQIHNIFIIVLNIDYQKIFFIIELIIESLNNNLNSYYLTEQNIMERRAARSMVGVHDQEHSFRSNRTSTQYNINDYLPPTINSISRTSVFASRKNEKDFQPNFKIKTQKSNDRELEPKLKVMTEQSNDKDFDANLKVMNQKISKRPTLEFCRNNIHFIYFPKFSQRYEVSVQTDAVQYSIPSNAAFTKIIPEKMTIKVDRQMSQIEQKLSKLNQFKKPTKEKSMKMQEYPIKFEKADVIFSKIDDKENMMRLSNTFERLSHIPEERVREETIEILPIQSDEVERLIRMYMQ